jgi:hypothetical protein
VSEKNIEKKKRIKCVREDEEERVEIKPVEPAPYCGSGACTVLCQWSLHRTAAVEPAPYCGSGACTVL